MESPLVVREAHRGDAATIARLSEVVQRVVADHPEAATYQPELIL